MVERLVHTEEVTGSMPVSPTRGAPGSEEIPVRGLRSFSGNRPSVTWEDCWSRIQRVANQED
jgi:hypothetical protein